MKEPAPDHRIHHLHTVAVYDPQWRECLMFRTGLRVDEALRARYTGLKKDLQEQFAGDCRGYTGAKNESIRGRNRKSSMS